jgi:uncharacterized membrane protein (UPF0127 family)
MVTIHLLMRASVTVLMLLFTSLLLVAGCGGGEEGEAPEETSEGTLAETVPTTTATEPETTQTSTLNIINSAGERVEVEVEIADDDPERQRGLMERTELAENAGMLFVFEEEQPRSFWMRNTLIPLSIAYISADGIIVDIQDMQPLDETSRPSAAPAQYALEVNQGFFAERGIGVGEVVELPGRPGSAETPSSAEVIQAFRDAGLDVGETYPVEQEPDWEVKPIPKSYEEATRFLIPSLEGDSGGRVFVFGSEGDLDALRDYYEGLPDSVRPHVYVEGQVLLQITNQFPKAEADRYGTVLRERL